MNVIARSAGRIGRFEAPVLTQEMRIRQRGAKPFWVLFVYVLVLSIVAIITYQQTVADRLGSLQGQDLSGLGRNLFYVLSVAQLSLVVVIVPAFSSSSITSERERGTLDLLSLTLLTSGSIVRQKLVAAIAQVLLMIVASLPVVGVTFLMGGVAPVEMLVVYVVLISTAVFLSAMGMLASCAVRNSRTSTFIAYLVPIVAFAGIPMCWLWLSGFGRGGFEQAMAGNPLLFAALFAVTGAIPAFAVYGFAILVLSVKTSWCQTRAFRIGVFGLSYAILLFVMSNPTLVDTMLKSSGFNVVEVLNPFTAISRYVNFTPGDAASLTYAGSSGSYGSYSGHFNYYRPWMVWLAIGFFIGVAYIFERISCLRLNAMRRT